MARNVLVPLTLAALLSFLLTPVCDWLERRHLGRIPSVLLAVSLAFGTLCLVAWTSAVQMTNLVQDLPVYRDNIHAKIESVNHFAKAAVSKITSAVETEEIEEVKAAEVIRGPLGSEESPFSVKVVDPPTNPLEIFRGMFGTMVEVLGTAGIVVVLLIFFLIRREDLRDRFIHLVGKGNATITIPMLEDAAQRVSNYLSMLFIINVSFGASVSLGLFLIGVPNAMLWGILAAVLRFIPYIGPWIAAVMPIALAMAISPGWLVPLLTVGLFIVLELISNNVLEPWLYGKNTGVSTVAVLLAAIFWMWLWGPIGLLLATPLTVCLLVIGKHVPQLAFLDVLLGSDPVFEPHTRVYQRLLAGDTEEAAELLEEHLEEKPLVEVYDELLLPALDTAQRHLHRGELEPERHLFVLQSMGELLQDRADQFLERGKQDVVEESSSPEDESVAESKLSEDRDTVVPSDLKLREVLCIPARTDADEVAARMLTQVLNEQGYFAQNIKLETLTTEMLDLAAKTPADVICISAVSPVAVMHARHICKRLRVRFPRARIVVGLWELEGDLEKAIERIGCNAAVVVSLAGALSKVLELAPLASPEEPLIAGNAEPTGAVGVQNKVA
jgi:predicted PurR-regulated permease PerM